MRMPGSRLLQAVAMGAVVLLGVATVSSKVVAAQVQDSLIVSDSEIQLVEQAQSGAYQHYRITVSARDGRTILTTEKDGARTVFEVSQDEPLTLWHHLLANDVQSLVDGPSDSAVPDQSQFTVRYRVGQTNGQFSVYGVDTLPDPRYRSIVRAILALGDKYSRLAGR